MIRVTARQARAIEAGRATQLRVLIGERRQVKRKDAERRGRSALRWQEPWHPTISAEETIRGVDDDGVGVNVRVVITDRWKALLGDMTVLDARREGHGKAAGSVAVAQVAWVLEHDKAWLDHHKVRLAEVFGPAVVPFICRRRFEQRWAGVETWVIGVKAVTETPLYLASQLDVLHGGCDYTPNRDRAVDELEVVDKAAMARYALHAEQAREQDRLRRRERRQGKRGQRLAMFTKAA